MRRAVGLVLAVLAVGIVVYLWTSSRARLAANLGAPHFLLQNAKGQMVRSDDLGDRPMLVHFWAGWCAPCMEELPELMQFAKDYPAGRLHFVLVSNDSSWDSAMKVISRGTQSDALILLIDSNAKVAERFGTFQLPETYLVSKENKILMKWVGPQHWGQDPIRKELDQFLQGQTPPKT